MEKPKQSAGGFLTKRGFGVYIGDDEISCCVSLVGIHRVTLEKVQTVPLTSEPVGDQVAALIESCVGKGATSRAEGRAKWMGRLPLIFALGVSQKSGFFSAFSITQLPAEKNDLNGIVTQNPRAYFLTSNDLAADWTSCKIKERLFALIGASRKAPVAKIYDALAARGMFPIRSELAAWPALRASFQLFSPKNLTDLEIRILLGPKESLVAVCQGTLPVGWQIIKSTVEWPRHIHMQARSLMLYASQQLGSPVKRVILQGTAASIEAVNPSLKTLNIDLQTVVAMPYDGTIISYGLSIGALKPESPALNLARTFQKPVPLLAIFPRFDAAISCVAAATVLFCLWGRITKLESRLRVLTSVNESETWAHRKSVEELKSMSNNILKTALPLSQFLTDRVYWAPLIKQIGDLVPLSANVTRLRMQDSLWVKSNDKELGERFITLFMTAPMGKDGQLPLEVDNFPSALRSSTLIAKNFANIQIKEIGRHQLSVTNSIALVSITCTPLKLKEFAKPGAAPKEKASE